MTPVVGLIVAVNATVFVLERIVTGSVAGWAGKYGVIPLMLMHLMLLLTQPKVSLMIKRDMKCISKLKDL